MKSEVYRISRAPQPRTFEFDASRRPLTADLIRLYFDHRWYVTLAGAGADERRPSTNPRNGRLCVFDLLRGDPHHGSSTVASHGR